MNRLINEFRTAISISLSEAPKTIHPNGRLNRFYINGKLNGWYIFHIDGRPNGRFGDWKTGISQKWVADGVIHQFSGAQKAGFKAKRQKIEAEQAAELKAAHDEAAEKARYLWDRAKPALDHRYLTLKNIKPHGTRIARDGRLIIPLFDEGIQIVNVQFIDSDGVKRFLKGGRKKGCFYVIGVKSERLCIAEGFATAASIYESTGQQTFVAFDAGNLEPVAKVLRSKFPQAEITLFADNDISGIGQAKAEAAAYLVAGSVMVCPIAGMDFNDYLNSNTEAAA